MKEGNYIDDMESFSYAFRTIDKGLRQNSATAYLRPVFPDRFEENSSFLGRNVSNKIHYFTRVERLHVVSEAYVTKILIDDDKKAYGVQYSKGGRTFTSYANKEVILSAGAFATPQLLMLSGIGPREELKKFNVRFNFDGLPIFIFL